MQLNETNRFYGRLKQKVLNHGMAAGVTMTRTFLNHKRRSAYSMRTAARFCAYFAERQGDEWLASSLRRKFRLDRKNQNTHPHIVTGRLLSDTSTSP